MEIFLAVLGDTDALVSVTSRVIKSLNDCRLYTFIDFAYLNGRTPVEVAQQLCDGGSDIIQLRAKDASPEEISDVAETILPITRRAGVPLVINDFFSVALELDAEYCHLGQEDFFDAGHQTVAELRMAGTHVKYGLSTHSPEQAARALQAGPDYIAIGPVYATGTKPEAKPVTLDYVRWAAQNVTIPWFAIGGIKLENLNEVLEAGAKRVCVVSGILNAPDIAAACQEFKKRL